MNEALIDSNSIIGSIKGQFSIENLASIKSYVSEISRLEILGYHKIKPVEEDRILIFLQNIDHISISKEIIDQAIPLRKNKSMSVGDAIIAATALINNLPLITANIKDFHHIENLKLIGFKRNTRCRLKSYEIIHINQSYSTKDHINKTMSKLGIPDPKKCLRSQSFMLP